MARLTAEEQAALQRKERKAARGLEDVALDCRDYRHAWKTSQMEVVDGNGLVRRVSVCTRGCLTEREDLLVRRTGAVFKRLYRHGEGYLIKGMGRVHVDTIRRELLARAFKG